MTITGKYLPRRTFLRGLGTTLALPLLDSMIPAMARAAAKTSPVRLGFVYHPTGMIMDRYTPAAMLLAEPPSAMLAIMTPFRAALAEVGLPFSATAFLNLELSRSFSEVIVPNLLE